MKIRHISYLYILPFLGIFSCQSGSDEGKTIASTHPKLEEQLAKDSLTIPAESGKDTALYSRYRITQDEYQNNTQYAVGEIYSGKTAVLDVASHKDAAQFKTELQAGLAKGVNFAGKYAVVSINCGTNCHTHYVMDAQSGKVLDRIQSTYGAAFTKNSRVFTINPTDYAIDYTNCTDCQPETLVFENGKFVKLP